MNFGYFAGGLAQGIERGEKLGKTMRELIKEAGVQKIREQGMAEAEAQRVADANNLVQENKQLSSQPTAPEKVDVAPATPVNPAAEAVSNSSPTASPDSASAKTAESTQNPMPPSVSTQSPAPVAQATPAQKAEVAPVTPDAPMTPAKVAEGGIAPTQAPTPSPTGGFTVKGIEGKTFNTREEALAEAQKIAPNSVDSFIKNTVPKIAQQYIANGEPDKALAWEKYAETATAKKSMKSWAEAYTAPDFDTAVSKFGKFYTEHVNDGVDFVGHKMLTKSDGSQVAVVQLKDKATGKVTDMELTKQKMLALAGAANPQKLWETEQAKQSQADKFRFEQGVKNQERKDARDDKFDLEAYKQDRLDNRQRELGSNKKTTDPTERRAIIASDLSKNNPKFERMTEAEQNDAINKRMKQIYGDQASPKGDEKPSGGEVKFSDKPMPLDKSLPIYKNNETGQRYHQVNGVMVPIADPTKK